MALNALLPHPESRAFGLRPRTRSFLFSSISPIRLYMYPVYLSSLLSFYLLDIFLFLFIQLFIYIYIVYFFFIFFHKTRRSGCQSIHWGRLFVTKSSVGGGFSVLTPESNYLTTNTLQRDVDYRYRVLLKSVWYLMSKTNKLSNKNLLKYILYKLLLFALIRSPVYIREGEGARLRT